MTPLKTLDKLNFQIYLLLFSVIMFLGYRISIVTHTGGMTHVSIVTHTGVMTHVSIVTHTGVMTHVFCLIFKQ